MSIRLMSAIWDSETVTGPTDLLVLLALADFANDDGVCWPAVGRVARRARISERQAQRVIKKLTEAGRLEIERRGNQTTIYRVIAPQKGDIAMSPQGDADDTPRVTQLCHPRVTPMTPQGDIAMSPDPPKNHQSTVKGTTNQGGAEGETALNCGEEGGNSPAADERPAAEPTNAGAELPAEVIAAWRWPLTAQARAFLRNAIAAHTAGEVLTAIEIAASQPGPIDRPAAYVKKVLRRRLSDLVDDAERRAPVSRPIPPDDAGDLPDPPPAPTRPPRDVALVRDALAEALPALARDTEAWPVTVNGAAVTIDAGYRAQWLSRVANRLRDSIAAYLQRPVALEIVGYSGH